MDTDDAGPVMTWRQSQVLIHLMSVLESIKSRYWIEKSAKEYDACCATEEDYSVSTFGLEPDLKWPNDKEKQIWDDAKSLNLMFRSRLDPLGPGEDDVSRLETRLSHMNKIIIRSVMNSRGLKAILDQSVAIPGQYFPVHMQTAQWCVDKCFENIATVSDSPHKSESLADRLAALELRLYTKLVSTCLCLKWEIRLQFGVELLQVESSTTEGPRPRGSSLSRLGRYLQGAVTGKRC